MKLRPAPPERNLVERSEILDAVAMARVVRRIAFEVDSDRFHLGLVDRMLDEAKTARLDAISWTVVRITERELWRERPSLIRRLRQVRWASNVRRRIA